MRRIRYVHERASWPEFTWDGESLASALASVRHKQGRLVGRLEGLGLDLRSEARLDALTSEAVKSSAIEGEALDPDEVRSSIASRLGLAAGGVARASRHVEGLVEMMVDATTNYAAPLTKKRLLGWHAALFPTGHSGARKITAGAWRETGSAPMQVVSGPLGKERVHFEAPAAERLEQEMKGFLDWFRAGDSIDPVLRAAIAHFWFVTIHPFDDGNGRIARAIADMALARADGTKERCYSMSTQIAAERSEYYRVLEAAQRGDTDVTEWLAWFLACLGRALDAAEQILGKVLYKARLWRKLNGQPINARQRTVIERLLGGFEGFLTTSKYAKLAKCSPDTALRDIQQLLDAGVLLRNEARGRSTSYRLTGIEELGND